MKFIYQGNIDTLSEVLQNSENKLSFFLDYINKLSIKHNILSIDNMFFIAKGEVYEKNNHLEIDLKIKVKLIFKVLGGFVLMFLSIFIFANNVMINGEINPSLYTRINFVLLGVFFFFLLPTFFIYKIRVKFKKELKSIFMIENEIK